MPVTEYNSGSSYKNGDIVCIGPCRLKSMLGYNSGPAQFICLYDTNVIPADSTTVPKYAIAVGAATSFVIDFDTYRDFDTGIVWSNSTTMPTKTIGAANCWVVIGYGPKINQ